MKQTLLEKVLNTHKDAEKFIRAGKVQVNNQIVIIPSWIVNENDVIKIQKINEYVSRGAYKLLAAIKEYKINFKGKIVLDIGSSTGGFTQVALKYGANHVYALDVGYNQLNYKLRINKNVTVLERTNLKIINENMFKWKIDIVVVDVSFISIRNVFNVLAIFKNIELIVLIKPQFEAFKDQVNLGGFVEKKYHKEIIDKIKLYADKKNFIFQKIIQSPITGNKSKNIEYLAYFKKR